MLHSGQRSCYCMLFGSTLMLFLNQISVVSCSTLNSNNQTFNHQFSPVPFEPARKGRKQKDLQEFRHFTDAQIEEQQKMLARVNMCRQQIRRNNPSDPFAWLKIFCASIFSSSNGPDCCNVEQVIEFCNGKTALLNTRRVSPCDASRRSTNVLNVVSFELEILIVLSFRTSNQ